MRTDFLQIGTHTLLCAELGHNMGADHANLWRASTTTGPGQSQEYYDMFGVMGVGSSDGV